MKISQPRGATDWTDDSGTHIQRHLRTINGTTWHFQRRTYPDGNVNILAHAPGKATHAWYGRP